MPSYHQTQAGLDPTQRRKYVSIAQTQEEIILGWFQARPALEYSPERVQELVMPGAPITSVRRALTNLTAQGHLVKAGRHDVGHYGRPVCMWRLADPPADGQLKLF